MEFPLDESSLLPAAAVTAITIPEIPSHLSLPTYSPSRHIVSALLHSHSLVKIKNHYDILILDLGDL